MILSLVHGSQKITFLVLSKVDGGGTFLGSMFIELSGAFIWDSVKFTFGLISKWFNNLIFNNMLKISKVIMGVIVVATAFNI